MPSREQVRFITRLILISLFASVGQTYFLCVSCRAVPYRYFMVSLFSFLMWVMLWGGNHIITRLIDRRISWIEWPTLRFLGGMVATVSYTSGMIIGAMEFFAVVFNFHFGNSRTSTIVISILITVIVSLFLHGRQFLINWRKLELDAIKLRNENLTSQFESLKSQMDPHFLFNSLNVLTNLVYENADQSARFIKQLSEVYRYVLEVRNKELVPLDMELKFVESYLFLQQIRFGHKLQVVNELGATQGFIPPLALQMLVENAIKHNVIAEAHPLTIKLYATAASLVVENNLQKKMILEDSTGIGLQNISKRYQLLTGCDIQVNDADGRFQVSLPLLRELVKPGQDMKTSGSKRP
jgi:sensor histidine kinase YesM